MHHTVKIVTYFPPHPDDTTGAEDELEQLLDDGYELRSTTSADDWVIYTLVKVEVDAS